jgi:hypothetical protein
MNELLLIIVEIDEGNGIQLPELRLLIWENTILSSTYHKGGLTELS